ncbi:glycoside hydrolase family 17 protein [Trichoderma atroviride IMI 206040]|uniref:glucan endo-1,3-beta-D-glucosidase n=1 Tax=Hypocrea atroviridis (strain ATCC 20476 / IMI 206040) TaxID=452589 RepID=G9P2B8_HYPAI|nr:glycoside hydrolase family 17 protein [Trichoderma atroviride IMI 206040]EHK43610.1 glycoside hydrolase family 17 protein [Trichoderma atroviride IMI 206040]
MQRYGEHGSSPEREPLDGYHAPPSPAYPPETPYHDSVSPQPHYRQPPPPVPQHQHQDYGYEHEHEHDYDEGQAPPPPHHQGDAGYFAGEGHNDGYAQHTTANSTSRGYSQNNVTPGSDNFSEMAAGGMAGIAYGVAERNARESGMQAIHGGLPPPPSHARYPDGGYGNGNGNSYGNGYGYGPGNGGYYHPGSERGSMGVSGVSGANSSRSPSRSARESRSTRDPYADDHYPQMYAAGSRNSNPMLGIVNPNEIVDDGDDGLDYSRRSQRNSTLGADAAKGAAAVTTAAVGAGAIRSALGRSGADAGGIFDNGSTEEKSAWMAQHSSQSKKWRWIISIIVVLLIIGGVVGGVVGSRVANKSGSKSGNGSGSSKGGSGSGGGSGDDDGSDLTINSQEIKDLLNNPDLHKVFPGIDYTPLNTQYPDCLANPPSQNNITRDVAVLSQLTNKIRLYGTDCNQTQMVLHSISALEMTSDIKVWMGVWQDNNATTNARQLAQMWDILDKYGDDPFEGIIVANEVLFRKQFTVASLGELLDDVRTNLTKNKYDLPVATSDLGDDWTQALADDSDYIMANVHPFFSGTTATEAADWTYSFWKGHDGPFWKTDTSKNIISETGWPTGGGKDCGGPSTCTNPAVAGIDELNTFMSDWVCQALENGTNYFWFEAFDEPWKVIYNTPTEAWEDKWGLMDANRKLKDGVKIPDCGGKTVS